jgi:hypothetical protein
VALTVRELSFDEFKSGGLHEKHLELGQSQSHVTTDDLSLLQCLPADSLPSGSGIVVCLHGRCLAMAVPLVPLF